MSRMRLISGVVAFGMVFAAAPDAHSEADHAAIARASLDEVIRPSLAALSEAGAALQAKVDALCASPSPAAVEAAKESFPAAVNAWSRVEILRFGPIVQDRRYERLFYWLDAPRAWACARFRRRSPIRTRP